MEAGRNAPGRAEGPLRRRRHLHQPLLLLGDQPALQGRSRTRRQPHGAVPRQPQGRLRQVLQGHRRIRQAVGWSPCAHGPCAQTLPFYKPPRAAFCILTTVPTTLQPLSLWTPPASPLGILTDIDDTLTTEGVVPDHVVDAIARLKQSGLRDRKSTRLNSSHSQISYAVFCLKKKKNEQPIPDGRAEARIELRDGRQIGAMRPAFFAGHGEQHDLAALRMREEVSQDDTYDLHL